MSANRPALDFRRFYDFFDQPIAAVDCGQMCAPHNPGGKPFCCDACHAVPVAYTAEWEYLRAHSDLWHAWRGDECPQERLDPDALRDETPEGMLLLACKGPLACQRAFRSISCRQFPFFPYLSADYRLIGLAYEWTYEEVCWVISNLGLVSESYRAGFVAAFDRLFSLWPEEMDSYAAHSEELRETYALRRRRIPILHRNGGIYLLSPNSERLQRVEPQHLPRLGYYR